MSGNELTADLSSALRGAWYMAGWSSDFPADRPVAALILDEPVVLFRREEGTLVALEDRCCHRLAPLSHGAVEGGSLRCMYHGLRFDGEGRCVEVPGRNAVPPALRVRSFPVVERHSAAWVWMGEAAKADAAQIPPFVGVEDPAWAMHPGHMDYVAHYKLIEDNLLDLSHIPYVHRASFGRNDAESNAAWARAPVHTTEVPRGVHVQRWLTDAPAPPNLAATSPRVDVETRYDYLVPGVFLLTTRYFRPGAAALSSRGEGAGEPLFESFSCQAVTPRSARATTYFFAYGPRAQHAALKDNFRDVALMAFGEDRVMIEAQQRVINADPQRRMILLDFDRGPVMYDRVVERLRQAQR
jgi:phenylpropionate dioxygenase-like ring-hydroxylating dioxygenase large terminal subunit